MELSLLIAIGINVISFISIVLTKPSPVNSDLVQEPAQAELIAAQEAQPRDAEPGQNSISSTTEEVLVEEEIMATLA